MAKFLLLILLAATGAQAHKTSDALPTGIFRARMVEVISSPVIDKFDADGQAQGLLAPLQQHLTTATLAAKNPDLKTLYDTLNSFEPNLGTSLYGADLLADAKVNLHQTTAALEYGLTRIVSIGIIVPFDQVSGNASFDARVTSQAAAIKQKVKGTMLEDGVTQFQAQMPTRNALAQSIFTSNGYQVPGPFNYQGLGDVEVGAFIQTTHGEHFVSGIETGFRLPTATHKRNYANLLDTGTGDGQLDYALELGFDYHFTKKFAAGLHSRYTWQLPHNDEMPVLKDGQSGLPNLLDPTSFTVVDRNLGDYLENEAYVEYVINRSLTPYFAYTYTYHGADHFSGARGYDYTSLAANTQAQSHALMIGMEISTIDAYVSKKMPVPLKIDFSYNKILGGVNATNSEYGRLDLIAFF